MRPLLLSVRRVTDTNPELGFCVVALAAWMAISPFLPAGLAMGGFSAGLLALTLCKRLVLSHRRLDIRRPLWSWLGGGAIEIPLGAIRSVRVERKTLVIETDGGVRRVWIGNDAERFAEAVEGEIRRGRSRARYDRAVELAGAIRRVPARAEGGIRCPFCHDDLHTVEVACGGCGTGHHAECLAEHGRCAILGCEPRRVARSAA